METTTMTTDEGRGTKAMAMLTATRDLLADNLDGLGLFVERRGPCGIFAKRKDDQDRHGYQCLIMEGGNRLHGKIGPARIVYDRQGTRINQQLRKDLAPAARDILAQLDNDAANRDHMARTMARHDAIADVSRQIREAVKAPGLYVSACGPTLSISYQGGNPDKALAVAMAIKAALAAFPD